MSNATDPWELLYEKHRALFEKAASQPLSKSDRYALTKALGELAELAELAAPPSGAVPR